MNGKDTPNYQAFNAGFKAGYKVSTFGHTSYHASGFEAFDAGTRLGRERRQEEKMIHLLNGEDSNALYDSDIRMAYQWHLVALRHAKNSNQQL